MIEKIHNIIIIAMVVFSLWVIVQLLLPTYKKRRHKRRIHQGKMVITVLQDLKGLHRRARAMSYLKKINPYTFEELVLTSLQNLGADIERNKSYSGDGGIDGRFQYNGKRFAVQAKCYTDYVVLKHITNFSNKIARYDGGLFVHTGKTRASTWKQLPGNVNIVSGERLLDMVLGKTDLERIITTNHYKGG